MTKSHFSQDNFGRDSYNGGSSSYANRSYGDAYGSSSRQSRRNDADDELKKAIELSKETAKKEEERRKRKQTAPSRVQDKDGNGDDFDIGLGFEKFATGVAGGRANDIDDFDFNNIDSNRGGDKKEENKQEDMFNFDVASSPQKNAANSVGAAQGGGDLMDLLGGPSQPQQNNQPQPGGFMSQNNPMGSMQTGFSQQNNVFDFGGSNMNSQSVGSQGNFGQSPQVSGAPADPFSPST